MLQEAIRSIGSLFFNRLLSGIWVPMLAALVFAILLATRLGWVAVAGMSERIGNLGGVFAFDFVAAAAHLRALLALQVAMLTLYISITLLVLTLAAQSLGSRLIERWIARIEIRATLVQWIALTAFTLTGLLFIAERMPVPRLLVLIDLTLTMAALGWLGFGYHRLARTAHIDTSLAGIGRSFATDRQDWSLVGGPDPDAAPNAVLTAWTSGYFSGFDRDRLLAAAAEAGARASVRVPDGGFVVQNDPLLHLWDDRDGDVAEAFRKSGQIAAYRSDRPTGPFSLALLVEVGARALSPSVNDHMTAGTCADWIGHGLAARLGEEDGPDGWFADADGMPRLHVIGSGVIAQSRPFLAVFQRAARPHPHVLCHLARAYGAALRRATHRRDRDALLAMLGEIADFAGPGLSAYEDALLDAALAEARGGGHAAPPERMAAQ